MLFLVLGFYINYRFLFTLCISKTESDHNNRLLNFSIVSRDHPAPLTSCCSWWPTSATTSSSSRRRCLVSGAISLWTALIRPAGRRTSWSGALDEKIWSSTPDAFRKRDDLWLESRETKHQTWRSKHQHVHNHSSLSWDEKSDELWINTDKSNTERYFQFLGNIYRHTCCGCDRAVCAGHGVTHSLYIWGILSSTSFPLPEFVHGSSGEAVMDRFSRYLYIF